jgi:hypothetical protein
MGDLSWGAARRNEQRKFVRFVPINWMETEAVLLEISVIICQVDMSSSARRSSAIEHAVSPAAARFSHARPAICRNTPCD